MNRSNGRWGEGMWQCLPLCRSYLSMHAASVRVVEPQSGTRSGGEVYWLVGIGRQAEFETLAVWVTEESGVPGWRATLLELKSRGVERIRFALSEDLLSFREDLRAAFPGAMALPSFAQLLDRSVSQVTARHRAPIATRLREIVEADSGQEGRALLTGFEASPWGARYPALVADWRMALEQAWALWTVSPALRREVLSGDGVAAVLNRSLRKAVARHGCFADVDEAHAFVVAALARAERRLEASRAGAVTEHNHHREGFRPRMDALGV